jgi:hypothetical protein
MKGKIKVEYEGGRYEREFNVEDEDHARALLKEIVTDLDERFLKGSRREPGAVRKNVTTRPSGQPTTNPGGEL